jgi:hypothetical protein
MANWRDFVAFVKSTYEISQEEPDMLRLMFETEHGRTQYVYLWRRLLLKGSEEWLVIESPFAEVGEVSLQKVLDEAGSMVCGGVVSVGRYVTYRHSLPLANLDVNEFERPLELVTLAADRLEHRLFGGDQY